MYTDFFGLKEKPFNLTPSPRFLYLGESHREALALLTYGVMERKGFILLTGEVGAGKTTMVQALLSNLDKNISPIYLSNPLLSPMDFINYLGFTALKKKLHYQSKTAFLLEFEEFLKRCLQHQRNLILIIDEAQKLSFALLEEIRLLSNMESAEEKLINIFLVGQPELNDKLSDPRCRPLLQRISIRHHISPLTLDETKEYVHTRLTTAGAKDAGEIFSRSVIKSIHHYSRGYPRMINILADNSLLLGYARATRRITPAMLKECYQDLQLEGSTLRASPEKPKPQEVEVPVRARKTSSWKWLMILFLLLAVVAFAMAPYGQETISRLAALLPKTKHLASAPPVAEKVVVRERLEKETRLLPEKELASEQPQPVAPPSQPAVVASGLPTPNPEEARGVVQEEAESPRTAIVKEGDMLAELATSVYGRVNGDILRMIQRHNAELEDINRIRVGQIIVFPPLGIPRPSLTFTVHIASFKPFTNARELFERLQKEGYEAYIIPFHDPHQGKVFRVTVGHFDNRHAAEVYASKVRKDKVSDYAGVVQLEVR